MSEFVGKFFRTFKVDWLIAVLYVLPVLLALFVALGVTVDTVEAVHSLSISITSFVFLYVLFAPVLVLILIFNALRRFTNWRLLPKLLSAVVFWVLYSYVYFWLLGLFDIREKYFSYEPRDATVSTGEGLVFTLVLASIVFLYLALAPVSAMAFRSGIGGILGRYGQRR